MTVATRLNGALASPTPTQQVYVVSVAGDPLPRVSEARADLLCSLKFARWAGHGTKRHLRMTVDVPQVPHGGTNTRRDRADHTCRIYATGQVFGCPLLIEHIPIPKD